MQYRYFYPFAGIGTHEFNKNARDAASRAVGLSKFNVSTLSSIIPPGCTEISFEQFREYVGIGEKVDAVNGVLESNVPGQRLRAGIAFVKPWDKSHEGFISEWFEHPGIEEDFLKWRVCTSAMQLFAENMGVKEFVAEDVWVPGQTTYTIGDQKVEVTCKTADVVVNRKGDYSVALVGAAFIPKIGEPNA